MYMLQFLDCILGHARLHMRAEDLCTVTGLISLPTGEGELKDETCGPLQRQGGGRHHLGVRHQEEGHWIQ